MSSAISSVRLFHKLVLIFSPQIGRGKGLQVVPIFKLILCLKRDAYHQLIDWLVISYKIISDFRHQDQRGRIIQCEVVGTYRCFNLREYKAYKCGSNNLVGENLASKQEA